MALDKTDLPAGWQWTTLGAVADPTRNRVNPQNYPQLPFVGMEHVEAHTRRVLQTVPAATMHSAAEQFQPGDVLYGRMRPYLNKVFLADFHGLCSGEFIPFRKTATVNSKYLLYFLNSWEFVSFASHLTEGDRPRVDFTQLASYPFPLPPRLEQDVIVGIIETQFSRLDAAEAALKRVQANLRRYRAAVLKAACEGRLVPTEAELAQAEGRTYEPAAALLERILAERRAQWQAEHPGKKYKEPAGPDVSALPELPEGWCWATLEAVASQSPNSISSGPFGSALGTKDYRVSGVPVIRGQNIRDGEFLSNNFVYVDNQKAATLRRSSATAGDLVIVAVGSSGNSALVPKAIDSAVLSQNINKIALDQNLVSAEYILGAMRIEVVRQQMKDKTTDVVRSFLSLTNLKRTAIPLPPLAEQKRVADEVDRVLSLSESLDSMTRQGLARTARLRQSILKQAFSGNYMRSDNEVHSLA